MNTKQRKQFSMWLVFFLLLCAGQSWLGAQDKQDPAKPLDLNTATAEQLDHLPEVGPKLAAAIVQFREKSGPFRRVEELLAVPGITKRRLEKIRPHVTVKAPAQAR